MALCVVTAMLEQTRSLNYAFCSALLVPSIASII